MPAPRNARVMAGVARTTRGPLTGTAYLRDLAETSLLAALIGACTGLIAVGVRLAIAFVTNVAFRDEVDLTFRSPVDNALGLWIVFVPAVGALLAYVVVRFLSQDHRIRGSSEVVRSVAMQRGEVSPRKVVGHATGTILSVGTGGSAGREGAMVQLGAALAMVASLAVGASARHRKLLLAAGGGAAIGATFNTPIAGVIFAMEVILLEWSTRAFIPLTVASAMGTLVATHFLGDQPAFPIPANELVSGRELFLYVLLGILCGLLAILLSRLLAASDVLFASLPGPEWLAHVWGGLLIGLVGFLAPQVFGVGYETVEEVLQGNFVVTLLAGVVLAKLVAYAITRGSSGSSGAFSPSFFLGSALGGIFGALVHIAFPTWTGTAGAYALVGMAAVYAAVTRASLTALVMLYEMTHSFSIVIPLMIAIVVADALAKAYGSPAYFRGGHAGERSLEADASANILDLVTVGEIMSAPVETVREDAPVRALVEKRFATGHQGYPVVDAESRLVGIMTSTDMRRKVKDDDLDKPVREFMTPDPSIVTREASAHEALTEMVHLDVGHLPVVDAKDRRRLVGILTRTDLVGVERRLLAEEERADGFLAPRTFKERWQAARKRLGFDDERARD
jgi:CIC family chloride channel protein